MPSSTRFIEHDPQAQAILDAELKRQFHTQGLAGQQQYAQSSQQQEPPKAAEIPAALKLLQEFTDGLEGRLWKLGERLEVVCVPAPPKTETNEIKRDERRTPIGAHLEDQIRRLDRMISYVNSLSNRLEL